MSVGVLSILLITGRSEIIDPVVGSDRISVIKLGWRPFTVDIEPGKSMGEISLPIHPQLDVTGAMRAAGDRANWLAAGLDQASEHACLTVVMK